MSESCRKGHKCMCFQCRETDCERYESEPPKWVKELEESQLTHVREKILDNYAKRREKKK